MQTLTHIPKVILFLILCALCVPLAAQQKQVVAVMEPVAASPSVTNMNKGQVRGAMEDFLTKSKRYRVVDRGRADLVFEELHLQRTNAMIDPSTAKAIGKHLAADIVCVSEIAKDEGYTNINISLINVETGVVAKSGSETVLGDGPAVIRKATEKIASRITGIQTDEERAAQSALRGLMTFGFYASAGIPMGDFAGMEYPPTTHFPVTQSEGYKPGFGGRFTMTFPLFFRHLALRAGAGFMVNGGSNTAPGYSNLDLNYIAFGASGELQVFFDEAYRHRGTYLFGGATFNSETFQESSDGFTDNVRKMRPGATAGIGHTFASAQRRAGGWTMELAYHTTLSAKDTSIGEPVSADYVRLSAGFVF